MFADDAVIFVTPTKGEVSMLARILELFGETTGLKTNFHKSTVVPIQCNNINLSDVLSGLPASRTSFPLKYLGLPLSMNRLKRVDFQPWIDSLRKAEYMEREKPFGGWPPHTSQCSANLTGHLSAPSPKTAPKGVGFH